MSEECVPVSFEGEMKDEWEMSVVEVSKDSKELFEDVFCRRWEGRGVVMTCGEDPDWRGRIGREEADGEGGRLGPQRRCERRDEWSRDLSMTSPAFEGKVPSSLSKPSIQVKT